MTGARIFLSPEKDPTAYRFRFFDFAAAQRAMLKRYGRSKDVSVGELLRLALEALAVKPARGTRRS